MDDERWNAVDRRLAELLVGQDPVLDETLKANAAAGLPPIDVSPPQGKLLQLLVQLQGARSILELGALGGYSTIWLARGLPCDGRLVSLELNPAYAEVARANVARSGLGDRVEFRVGPALESMRRLAAEGAGPFDLIFIDADKETTPEYFSWALELSRPGSLIVTDNVVRAGAVIDPEDDDARVEGMRRFIEQLAHEPRVFSTVIQTVGSKGYDGFAIALVTGAEGHPRAEGRLDGGPH
jgi:predicted O-methyltransferase YrrM